MSPRHLLRGVSARIVVATLLVAGTAIILVSVGVIWFGGRAFEALMVEHGETVAASHAMFDSTVTAVVIAAVLVSALVSVVLAVLVARRLTRPLDDLAVAARRVAEGDYAARVRRAGPEELVSLADSFNQMAESLGRQEQLRRDFVVNASHELRTPLTNLQGYLEAMRDGVVPADAATFDSLREEVDRLTRLARSLETLAESADGTAELPDDLDLAVAVRAAVDLAQPAFGRGGIGLSVDLPARLPVRARPDHLAQVLGNLLQNAIRYTPEGGRCWVKAESRPGSVLVSVANTGPAIPEYDLARVFERFYRVEKSRDQARGGAGIGLAIVKELVETDGGRVGAESRADHTQFWFSLPA